MLRICALALTLTLAGACSGRVKGTSCDDDLTGSWRGEAGTWMLLDAGETLEGYPIFKDVPAVNAAPRLIDLRRLPALPDLRRLPRLPRLPQLPALPRAMVGEVHRRWMQGASACEGTSQLHVIACRGDQLELVLGDPMAPVTYAPCAWAGTAPTHREVWTRE